MQRPLRAPRLASIEGLIRGLILALILGALAVACSGCAQVRGRKMIQDANELYKKGKYREAVALFEQAEPLVPQLPVLWLNKGYTCRQLITPGAAPTAESRRWTGCALGAFTRLKEIAPADPRGEQLYIQTLFDANDFAALETMFLAQNRRAQGQIGGGIGVDLDAATGLTQIYFKWGKWAQALSWARKAADAQKGSAGAAADAQYRLGAFIWQLLSSRGGGAEMAAFDPRAGTPAPDGSGGSGRPARRAGTPASRATAPAPPAKPPGSPPGKPPAWAPGDISGALRIELAEEGIRYLEKAVALRPRHPEAMIYLNLLYRQESFAFFTEPAKWQAAIDRANEWQKKGIEAHNGTGNSHGDAGGGTAKL